MPSLTREKSSAPRHDVKCLVCDQMVSQAVYRYHYERGTSDILRCAHCGHLFIYPVPLADLDARTMDSIGDAEFSGNKWMKWLHEHLVIDREIREVQKHLTSSKPRLLDIGCGTGWSTSIWQKKGFTVTGLEPSLTRSKVAREVYHLNVSNDHLEHFTAPELFDVVVLRHLLEHIEDPAAMLTKIKSFLKPEGVLVIVIPNIDCIGRHVFKENWEWILPWHLHFYTPKTLSRLLTKLGYKKLKIYQMPSPLWYPHTINKVIFKERTETKFPDLMSLVLCSPIILLGLLLNKNDNMTLIFRNSTTAGDR